MKHQHAARQFLTFYTHSDYAIVLPVTCTHPVKVSHVVVPKIQYNSSFTLFFTAMHLTESTATLVLSDVTWLMTVLCIIPAALLC